MTVFVPDDPEWISLFTGAIYRLGQQVWYDRDAAHTAKIIADRWKLVYYDLMTRMRTGNPCEGSGTVFDIRLNPSDPCELQKTFDGSTWVHAAWLDECFKNTLKRNPKDGSYGWYDGIDFFRVPDGEWVDNPPEIVFPEPKVRGGTNADLCIASASASRVLQQLYRETWDWFAQSLTLGSINLAQQLVAWTDIIFSGTASLYDMISHAEDLYLQSAAYTDGGFPDSLLDDVQNILYCRASFDAQNRVKFDFNGVVSDFGAAGSDPYGGLNFLLSLYLGENGLNAAGNIVAVDAADCSAASCNNWAHQWLGGAGLQTMQVYSDQWWSFIANSCAGVYDAVEDDINGCLQGSVSGVRRSGAGGRITFPERVVTAISMRGYVSHAVSFQDIQYYVRGFYQGVQQFQQSLTGVGEKTVQWSGSVLLDRIDFAVRSGRSGAEPTEVEIRQCNVEGEGDNPFD